jgi:hypothetical protein
MNEGHAFSDMGACGAGTDRRRIRAAREWDHKGGEQRRLEKGSHLYSSTTVKVTSAVRSACRARSKAVMKRPDAIAYRLKETGKHAQQLSRLR